MVITLLRAALACFCATGLACALAQTAPANGVPGFRELEAAGATLGEVRILNQEIFDLNDPKENNFLYAWANQLHIQTRAGVIERSLLLHHGDRVSVRLIEETERLLRSNRFLYDVRIRPVAYRDGVVDIEVLTRDTWSLDPGVSAAHAGGANSSSAILREYNLLGTGMALSYGRTNLVDRSSNELQFQVPRAFDGWTTLSYAVANNSDGRRQAASVLRPFYALDTRWAAGISAASDDRIDSVYNSGVISQQYRHRQQLGEAFAGRSRGLVEGWTQRTSVGLTRQDDAYALEPARVAPNALPRDQKTVAPFVRVEVIEDRFEQLRNRNLIAQPEFFAMGTAATLQLGRAFTGLGASQNLWVYSAALSQGFAPAPQQQLLTTASASGTLGAAQGPRHTLSATARYYLPLAPGYLIYGALSADAQKNPDPADQLTLGGDNGLRGYPLRYQTGERRALLTLEARAYTDWYLWRLFRIGGAAFYDAGRAWDGQNPNTLQPGWLSNVGMGLRIFNVRSAFGSVLHADIALPIHRDPSIQAVQFLIKAKTSF